MEHQLVRKFLPSHFVALIIALAVLLACNSRGVDSLVGEYAITEGGKAELRITRSGGNFYVSPRKQGDEWGKPEQLVECSDDDYQKIFGSNWRELDVSGLRVAKGPFGIFRVKKGGASL